MSISGFGMKPHSFSTTSVVSQMSSSQTASKSTKLLPKRGQSQKFVKARSTNVPPKLNYQNIRKSLNNGVGVQRTFGFAPSVDLNNLASTQMFAPNSGVSSFAAIGSALGQTAIGILNETGLMDKLADKISGGGSAQPKTNTQELETSLSTLSNPTTPSTVSIASSDVNSTISAMTSSNDTVSLGKAINNAKAELMNRNALTTHLESESAKAQEAIPTCESDVSEAQTGVNNASQQVSQGKQNVKAQQTNRDVAKSNYDDAVSKLGEAGRELQAAKTDYTAKRDASIKADTAYTSAQNNTKIAETNLQTAESTLASTPQTITDSNGVSVPNPAYVKAQKAVTEAKAKLEEAKTKENEAKTQADTCAKAMQQAEKIEMEMEKNLGIAEDSADATKAEVAKKTKALDIAQLRLDNAVSGESKAQDILNTANNNLTNAQNRLDDMNGAVTKLKQHLQDINSLNSAITSQEQRLEQMKSNPTSTSTTPQASQPQSPGAGGSEKVVTSQPQSLGAGGSKKVLTGLEKAPIKGNGVDEPQNSRQEYGLEQQDEDIVNDNYNLDIMGPVQLEQLLGRLSEIQVRTNEPSVHLKATNLMEKIEEKLASLN